MQLSQYWCLNNLGEQSTKKRFQYRAHLLQFIEKQIDYFKIAKMNTDQKEFAACMKQLKDQITALSASKNLKDSSTIISELTSSLRISNSDIKYQLLHGAAFKEMLDPRDQVLEHEFNFEELFSEKDVNEEGTSFTQTKLCQKIMDRIKIFLVEATSNVVSIAFKFMCKGDLQEKQAKEYASKNIMLNLHAIFRQTIAAIEDNKLLKKYVKLDEIKETLIIRIQNILNNILINLADCYPQAPASGGTPRMRQIITEMNRQDDVENDFFFTSGFKEACNFQKFLTFKKETDENGEEVQRLDLGEEGDYIQFIMGTINAAIQVTHNNKDDERGRTVFQVFNQFNEHLFWVAQQKQYQHLLNTLDKDYEFDQEEGKKDKKQKGDQICQLFQSVFKAKEKGGLKSKKNIPVAEISQLWSEAEEGIENMNKRKHYALGQKIPASVKSFTREEIKNKQFSAKHSSVLRILTKWAENLEKIFENPQKSVKNRLYPFQTHSGSTCSLKRGDKDGDLKLCRQLQEQYKQIRAKFSVVLTNSYGYIGKLLSSEKQSVVSSINRYTQTRTISSKINAVLTSLMLSYTNMLIHHLLRAGQNILTEKGYEDIDLLIFRVSDLMRSKFQCSQNTFLSVLKTMYLLDSRSFMSNRFRIVRIKNKLDDPSNNIMINYLFNGKVECELQLSIQEAKGKQKNYYTFSHFVYELTRGKFGAIAECAIMISQLDPMINACKSGYYEEKQETIGLIREKEEQRDSKGGLFQSLVREPKIRVGRKESVNSSFFQCSVCNKLITIESFSRIIEKPELKLCYECFLKQKYPEELLKTDLKTLLKKISRHRLRNYRYLRSLRQQKYLITLTSSGALECSLVAFLPRELRTLELKLDSQILGQFEAGELNFGELDYYDLTSNIQKSWKKPVPLKALTYYFDRVDSIPEQLLTLLNLNRQSLKQKGKELFKELKDYIKEENIIKTIKYKAEIIQANEEEGKVLDKVCRVLVLGEGKKVTNKAFEILMFGGNKNEEELSLKYNKVSRLDLSNMTTLEAQNVRFTQIPKWLNQCVSLKKLDLDRNSIKIIEKDQLPPSLVELILKVNALESIDVEGLVNLQELHLQKNPLTQLKIGQVSVIKSLSIHNTLMENVSYLPPSLEVLWADRKAIVQYDFLELINLKFVKIRSGHTNREELMNIGKEVKVESRR